MNRQIAPCKHLMSCKPSPIYAEQQVFLCIADGVVKVGNRTECALLELCSGLGGSWTRIRAGHELVRRYPFSSDRKRMSSLTFNPGER